MNIGSIMAIGEDDELKERYITLTRGSCADESRVVGDEVIIKSKGKIQGKLKLREICNILGQRFKHMYDAIMSEIEDADLIHKKWYEDGIGKKKWDSIVTKYMSFIVTYEKVEKKLKTNNPEYLNLKKQILEEKDEIDLKMSKDTKNDMIVTSLYSLLNEQESKRIMTTMFNEDTSFTADDAYSIIKEWIPKEDFRGDSVVRRDIIIGTPTKLIKKLEKAGYIDTECCDNFSARSISTYDKDLNYESKFLSSRSCIIAYLYGLMDLEHLKKNFSITALFDYEYLKRNDDMNFSSNESKYVPFFSDEDGEYTYKKHADLMLQILDDVQPDERFSQGFWNYYMNGIFTREQIEKCTEEAWMYIPDICEEYIKSHRIPNYKTNEEKKEKEYYDEIDFIFDDDEKVYEFFTPKMVVSCLLSYRDEKVVDEFVNQYVKEMYKSHSKDFSEEIYKALLDGMEEEKYSTDKRIQNIIDMYTNNYIGIDQIKNHPLLEDELEELKKQGIENRILTVDLYNNSLVNQDDIFEAYEENDVFDMINSGMNPSVLNGYYSTQEIINFILTNKINNSLDLSSLRQGINIEDIKRMYQAERSKDDNKLQMINGISYDDLNMLVTCGIITKEEADEIDQAYDYNSKIEKLMEQGLIVGDKNGTKVARNEGDGSSIPGTGYGPGKIDEWDKYKLLSALDEDSIELELNSDVLENYSLIIMPNNKIAIMEPTEDGHGASYVMSIKLALEQISNSENIDKEEIVDPLKEYANRTGIRSIPGMEIANHGENWGYNLKKKMENIHPNINELIYSKDKDEQEKNTRMAKIEKMQKEIQAKYLQAREKAKNINNVEVE